MRRFLVLLMFVLYLGNVQAQSVIKQPIMIDISEKGLGEFKAIGFSGAWGFSRQEGDKIDVYEFTSVREVLIPPIMQMTQTLTVKEFDEFILKDYNDNHRNPKRLNIGRMHAENMVFKKLYLKEYVEDMIKYYEVTFNHSSVIQCYRG